jgi:hypothetical protein
MIDDATPDPDRHRRGARSDRPAPDADERPDLTVVMPCLNEAETLETCIRKASTSAQELGLTLEIVIADNGSTDGSQEIARQAGAFVIDVDVRGYGAALRAGIERARADHVIIADADDSYALDDLGPFVEALDAGADLVMGNRFKGGVMPGAMPTMHRVVGNPILSFIGRRLFSTEIGDFHCGMRGFRRQAILDLDLHTTGMEYASEMVVRASLDGLDVREVPTVLRPDGRTREPHLRTWRDGWRHLRFLLLFSPRWLLLLPGIALVAIGLIGLVALLPGPVQIGSVELDIHALLYAHLAVVVGVNAIVLACFARVYAVSAGLLPESDGLTRWLQRLSLERVLVVAILLIVAGLIGSIVAVAEWGSESFEGLDPSETMRIVIPSVTGVAIGAELVLASFVIGVLALPRR